MFTDKIKVHREFNLAGLVEYAFETKAELGLNTGMCQVTRYAYDINNKLTGKVVWQGDYWQSEWDNEVPEVPFNPAAFVDTTAVINYVAQLGFTGDLVDDGTGKLLVDENGLLIVFN